MLYQLIRTYRLNPHAGDDVRRLAEADLLPRLRTQPGFRGYRFVLTADDRAVSESDWATDAEAASANYVEATWTRDRLTPYLAGLPDEFFGPIKVSA